MGRTQASSRGGWGQGWMKGLEHPGVGQREALGVRCWCAMRVQGLDGKVGISQHLPFTRPSWDWSVIRATFCSCQEYAWLQHLQEAGQAGDEGL